MNEKLTVVTGWSPAGYLEYGRRFAETFAQFWPKDVDLIVYGEEPVKLPRGEFRTLDRIPGCMEFLLRHNNRVARGKVPAIGFENRWKPKHKLEGYNFRFDAWKFCRQGFIPENAASGTNLNEGRSLLCWLDGDVVTHTRVPAGFINGLLPEGSAVAYLGRGLKHSEIGFQLYDLSRAWPMLQDFAAIYRTDEVFTLKEWHSAFVFDEARRRSRVRAHDLTPQGYGHVWHQSPLRMYMDHLKGDRKKLGKSNERT